MVNCSYHYKTTKQISPDQGLELGEVECFDNTVNPKPESELFKDPVPTSNSTTGETVCTCQH